MINNPCSEHWQEMLVANRQRLTVWKDITTVFFEKLEPLTNTEQYDLDSEEIPLVMLDRVSDLIDETFEPYSMMDYYLKLSLRFEIFYNVVGLLVRQIYMSDTFDDREVSVLKRLTQAIIIKSVKEPPFTIDTWKLLSAFLTRKIVESYLELIEDVELQIMYLTGNTVYTYFEDHCSKSDVDALLEKAYKTLMLEENARQYSSRHGNGHTKTILLFVERWQENRQMKEVDRIKPFLVCLEAYWHGKIRLGSRQGVEKMYQKKRY